MTNNDKIIAENELNAYRCDECRELIISRIKRDGETCTACGEGTFFNVETKARAEGLPSKNENEAIMGFLKDRERLNEKFCIESGLTDEIEDDERWQNCWESADRQAAKNLFRAGRQSAQKEP